MLPHLRTPPSKQGPDWGKKPLVIFLLVWLSLWVLGYCQTSR